MTRTPSKTLAVWLTLAIGMLGLHRLYLGGRGRWMAWLYPAPTLAGLYGVMRMGSLGQDDPLAWLLIPLLGLTLSVAMLEAILTGLTPDARWRDRYGGALHPSGWGAVLGIVVALMLGATVLFGTIAFSGQKFFEWEAADQGPEHDAAVRPPGIHGARAEGAAHAPAFSTTPPSVR